MIRRLGNVKASRASLAWRLNVSRPSIGSFRPPDSRLASSRLYRNSSNITTVGADNNHSPLNHTCLHQIQSTRYKSHNAPSSPHTANVYSSSALTSTSPHSSTPHRTHQMSEHSQSTICQTRFQIRQRFPLHTQFRRQNIIADH